ncbi:unnamed protein product [Adineta ricciae]|uniref:AMP-dependent synthetase/ligase domain-containing protein n=1 Tax=Adineta ricciae TaxID=249248 RepID=A0A815SIT3_ADIRI|nr:unnamed protein product [Adineta ricciae]CAF1493669.1 unnamed protein product [Adineta ricciae]
MAFEHTNNHTMEIRSLFSSSVIHQEFVAQASNKRNCQKLALVLDEQSLTYAEIMFYVQKLAMNIIEKGFGKYQQKKEEFIVFQYVRQSIEMCIGMFTTLTIGGAYLGLNPNDPIERTEILIDEIQSNQLHNNILILVHSVTAKKFHVKIKETYCIVQIDNILQSEEINAPICNQQLNILSNVKVNRESLAFLIGTSGSTSKPKFVERCHCQMIASTDVFSSVNIYNSNQIILQIAGCVWIWHLFEFVSAMILGSTLVMLRPGGNLNMSYLTYTIQEKQVTAVTTGPSLMKQLAEYVSTLPQKRQEHSLLSIQTYLVGGNYTVFFSEHIIGAKLNKTYLNVS